MVGFMPDYYHSPGEFIHMIVVVIPVTIGQRTPVFPPTQAHQIHLQHHSRNLQINGIIGLPINHLKGLQTLTRPLSQPMPLGIPTILYLMMGPPMINNASLLENTNSIPLTPTNTTIYGISGNIKASKQTIIGNSPILICPDMTDNLLFQE